jgi:hypothetical protein
LKRISAFASKETFAGAFEAQAGSAFFMGRTHRVVVGFTDVGDADIRSAFAIDRARAIEFQFARTNGTRRRYTFIIGRAFGAEVVFARSGAVTHLGESTGHFACGSHRFELESAGIVGADERPAFGVIRSVRLIDTQNGHTRGKKREGAKDCQGSGAGRGS